MYNFDTDLLQFLPGWYKQVIDFQALCDVENTQIETAANSINSVFNNLFFQTMDISTIEQWEKILNIIPNPTTESLDFRRVRVINRVSYRPPFTLTFLYRKLDELIGPNQWEVNIDYPNYTIYIKSSALNQQYAIEVSYTINRIKPAHIVYINQPFLSEGITLDEQVNLTQTIYHYKLGTWGLGINPFASSVDKGEIVLPSQLSVQQELLTDTANFVESDIVSARINGTTTISDLTKSVSGSTVTVEYTVTSAEATTVTQIELLDSDNNALTSSAVYVPISDPAVFTHTIPVQEANT